MTNIALAGTVAPPSDIRKHFPALERQVNQIPVAYFDGAGCAGYTTAEEIDRLVHAISEIAGKVDS